ncbi:MAG: NAD(P)H-dependent oxidoreductase [Clostridiales bacterium]|nr:NAD(P)H-dependent oxidoreductase [Clostridiales bacterium]
MSEKLMILYGSPRPDSTVKKLSRQILGMLPGQIKVVEYDTYRMMARPCLDCRRCMRVPECVLSDLNEFFADFEDADYVIFATPVYNHSFPAPMKAVLDRTQVYYNKHFALGMKPAVEKPKSCGIVLSSGRDDEAAYTHMVDTLRQCLSVMNGKLDAKLVVKSTDGEPVQPDEMMVKSFVLKLLLSGKKRPTA